jgi:hypothetical protein
MKNTYNILLSAVTIIVILLLWKFIAKSLALFGYEPFSEGLILMIIPMFFLPIFVVIGILKLVVNRKDSTYKKMKLVPILVCFVLPVLITLTLNYFVYKGLMMINFIMTSIAVIVFIAEMIFCIFIVAKKDKLYQTKS